MAAPSDAMRGWRPPVALVDVGVVVGVALVISIAITVARESNSGPPDALAYALGGLIAVLVLGRRRWPRGVLIGSAAVLVLYYALQYPGISPALALAVPLYVAAVAGRIRWSLGVVAFFVLAAVLVRAGGEREQLLPLLVDTVETTSLMVVVVLLGASMRSRRQRAAAAARALAAAEAEREREGARRVAEERLRIARELHDVLAHTIATVTVQAGVAVDVLDDSPAEARAALREIRTASRAAMEELRAAVGVLRDGDRGAPLAPLPTLQQLDGLLSVARRSGVHVGLDRSGDSRPLPAAVELTAYRIVQESLTNVVRHARAGTATVALRYRPDALVVEIADDGPGPSQGGDGAAGHGINGMRERAAALGGSLLAGPRDGGGFGVVATLPLELPT
ncbi:MAG: sensor histidine kinase [Pseudonocardiales bacterium]|nr:sensor histidine kinase [Pseudonocardiales bacterium]